MSHLLLLVLEVSFCVAFVGRGKDLDLLPACTRNQGKGLGAGFGAGLVELRADRERARWFH